MAFAFTLTGKRRLTNEDPETMTGKKWQLNYSFTCLSGDTSGAKNIAADLGGSLAFVDIQVTFNALLPPGVTTSGTTITITKAGTAVTGGYMTVIVTTK